MLTKPESVAADDFKSAKWDELTRGRSFEQADAPALALLCQWHKVAQQAMDELDSFAGDLKAFPQIGALKTASAEIRQLNKQLGISDQKEPEKKETANGGNVLSFVAGNRAAKRKAAVAN